MDEPRRIDAEGPGGFERRLEQLAPRLRDDGLEPGRDLWPAISAAIDAAAAPRRRDGLAVTPRPAQAWWPTAALAAAIVLMIGVGLAGRRPGDADPAAGARATAPATAAAGDAAPAVEGAAAGQPATAARDGLREVGRALADVQSALTQAPDDPDLARLVMLIHHSRGRLLRLQAEDGVRGSRRAPA